MDLNWFEHAPVSLVIDTSSLVAERFDLSTKKMNTIKASVQNGDFRLITTAIYRGEFLKHSKAQADDELAKVEKFGLSRNTNSEHLAIIVKGLQSFSPESLWGRFCSDLNALDISCEVSCLLVFEDYFHLRAPFSEKKKTEFPDAFNLKMIEQHRPRCLVIISSDPDYDAWAAGKAMVRVFKTIQEFTNEYVRLKDPDFVTITDNALKEFIEEIKTEIENSYAEPDYYPIDSFHSEISDAEVQSVNLKKSFIVAISPQEGFATYRLIFSGSSSITVDSPVVVYDSVDKEDVTLGHNTNSAIVEFTAYTDVTLVVHDNENIEYVIDDTNFEVNSFDVPHEWENFVQE
jgi:hypothetical protein